MHKAFTDPTHVPGRFAARWARWVGWTLSRLLYRVTTDGRGNVPRRGPVLLASNHVALVDGPLELGMCRRPVHFLIKKELTRGFMGTLMYGAGQIAVDRGHGRDALTVALKVLQRGDVVGIFPEGKRSNGRLTEMKAGVAWLAVHADVPVVPVTVLGTRRTGEKAGGLPPFRRHLHVSFGEPIRLPLTGDPKADVNTGVDLIRRKLTEHVDDAQVRIGIELPVDDPHRGRQQEAA